LVALKAERREPNSCQNSAAKKLRERLLPLVGPRCTPAMRAGVSDHVWSTEEIVGLLDFAETRSN
jgi:hypothetical protein